MRPLAAQAKVKSLRRKVMCNLEDYINDRQYERRGRCVYVCVQFSLDCFCFKEINNCVKNGCKKLNQVKQRWFIAEVAAARAVALLILARSRTKIKIPEHNDKLRTGA